MRRRLVIAIAGVASAAIVLFALPLAVVLERSHRDEELLRLQRDTVAATRQIDLGTGRGDPIELPETSDALVAYDRAGRRVAGTGPAVADGLVRSVLRDGRLATDTVAGRLIVAVPLLSAERVNGAVRATRDDAPVARSDLRAWLALGGLALALIVISVLAALLLGGRLAKPLERLAAAARRLGEGDFAARAPRAGVAELDAVGEALDATAERLDDLISRERAFSADASHQLRTPLAALRLELEAMELGGNNSPELRAALAQIDRLQKTISTLLSAARGTHGRNAETDLTDLLDRVEGRWRATLAADGRPLRARVEGARPVAAAAARVVDEVLDVLISNAHRHGAGAITATVRELEGWLAIDIADEGRGFAGDPEDAFARRPPSGDGHGIGLPLARSLATAEGGSLVATRTGARPIVTLVLPRVERGRSATGSGQ